jgi:hypothetical protein
MCEQDTQFLKHVVNIYSLSLSLSLAKQPNSGQRRLIFEVSSSHNDTLTFGRTPLHKWSAPTWQHTKLRTDR